MILKFNRLLEECGSLILNIAKLQSNPSDDNKKKLEDEIADVLAACALTMESCNLDEDRIKKRSLNNYHAWLV